MRLPNGDRANVSLDRLTTYLLNTGHLTGKHKARVFASALGLTVANAGVLQTWLQECAHDCEAEAGWSDEFGQRFAIRAEFSYNGRKALIRSAWIIRSREDTPEFLTAFVE